MALTNERIAALIIRDKRLLLVTGYGSPMFWTPGGRGENGESHGTTMSRELMEELGIKRISMDFYMQGLGENWEDGSELACYYYFVQFEGEPTPREEISKFVWATGEEIQTGVVVVDSFAEGAAVKKLTADGLL